jgi:hypothetical protein
LLRQPVQGASYEALPTALKLPLKDVHDTLNAMLAFAEKIRADKHITDVVNIGIGGSDLGPQMAVMALQSFAMKGKRVHFVSNVDGHELDAVLKGLQAANTLFLIASKTFTTLDTMSVGLKRKAARMFRVTLRRSPPMWKLLESLVFKLALAFGIGWAADIHCGRPLVCPWPLPLARIISVRFWRARMPWTNTS